jgi:hypothetical protein
MKKYLLIASALFALSSPALAQTTTGNEFGTGQNGKTVEGTVQMCLNASGIAVPVDAAGLNCGNSGGNGPPGSVQATGVFAGADTSTASAALGATVNKTNYACSLTITGLGATALTPVVATIAGLIGGNTLSYTYIFPAGATTAATPLVINFSPCIAASAANSAITATVPGAAGNTATQINITGFRL